MTNATFNFVGGETGSWRIVEMKTVAGLPLEQAAKVEIVAGTLGEHLAGYQWNLRGVVSNERYVTRAEKNLLIANQPALNRPAATCAALIPISKSAVWWNLAQDERRDILETRSAHIKVGLKYLPAIARRLHHCREIGGEFDFLTWFEYAPTDAEKFDELVNSLRQSEEWSYVEREVDIRLVRETTAKF